MAAAPLEFQIQFRLHTLGDLIEAKRQPADGLQLLAADQKEFRSGFANIPDQHRRCTGASQLGQHRPQQGDTGRFNAGRRKFPLPEGGLHRRETRQGRAGQEPARTPLAIKRQTIAGLETDNPAGVGAGMRKTSRKGLQSSRRGELSGFVVSSEIGESLPGAQRADHARRPIASLGKDAGERLCDGRLVVEGDFAKIFDHRGMT